MNTKPRVVKDFANLDKAIQEQIKLLYPFGFAKHLVEYRNAQGQLVSALPFEGEEKYYLVRMSVKEAHAIIREDDDYDDDGNLKSDIQQEYEEKHDIQEYDLDEDLEEDVDA